MNRKRVLTFAVGALLAAAIAGGVAYATIPGPGNVYSACMFKGIGTIRLIDKSLPATNLMSRCTDKEIEISWNQAGQPGPPGPQGAKGEPGAPGTNGTNGTNGKDGVSVTTAAEPVGANCAGGGVQLTAVNGVSYVCNGPPGAAGSGLSTLEDLAGVPCTRPGASQGSTRVSVTVVAAGDVTLRCSFAAGDLYWVNPNGIGRAELDGQGANPSFITGCNGCGPVGVTVDAGHVYWTNRVGNTIGRADLDGQNANQSFITGAAEPEGVAVDAGHVYWANRLTGTIGRADLDGQNANQSFITGADKPVGVAVDAGHVYWSNRDGNTIGRADVDGQNANQSFITGASNPHGVAVDAGHVYWANRGGADLSPGTLGRADLDGQNANQSFITGADSSRPYGVAVDAGHVYWANSVSIGRADLDGQNANQRFMVTGFGVAGVAVNAG